jgi:hypothetical protein
MLIQSYPALWLSSRACPYEGLFLRSGNVMTTDDSLSLILRRLDEIERKLDHAEVTSAAETGLYKIAHSPARSSSRKKTLD